MAKIKLESKKVTIMEKTTSFVFEAYKAALSEAGFTNDSPIDARLQAPDIQHKKGFANKGKAIVGKATDTHTGYEYIKLLPIEVQLSNQANSIYELYFESWINRIKQIDRSSYLPTGELDEKEITGEKIYSPHVFIMHLCVRLFAFTLDETQVLKDPPKYHMLLSMFTSKLLKEGCPLYKSNTHMDAVAKYLACSHMEWLADLDKLLSQQQLFSLHKKAFQDLGNLINSIEKVITQQLIAYLDPEATKDRLHIDCCGNTFKELQQKKVRSLIQKDKEKYKSYNSLINQKKPADDKLTNDLALKLQYRTAVIAYIEISKEKYNIDKIMALYDLFEQTVGIRKIIAGVRHFIEATGWLGILTGAIRVSALSEYLKEYYFLAASTLRLSENDVLLSTKAGSALIAVKACNLSAFSTESLALKTNFQNLENPELREWVQKQIKDNLVQLDSLQKQFKLEVVNLSQKELLSFIEGSGESLLLPTTEATTEASMSEFESFVSYEEPKTSVAITPNTSTTSMTTPEPKNKPTVDEKPKKSRMDKLKDKTSSGFKRSPSHKKNKEEALHSKNKKGRQKKSPPESHESVLTTPTPTQEITPMTLIEEKSNLTQESSPSLDKAESLTLLENIIPPTTPLSAGPNLWTEQKKSSCHSSEELSVLEKQTLIGLKKAIETWKPDGYCLFSKELPLKLKNIIQILPANDEYSLGTRNQVYALLTKNLSDMSREDEAYAINKQYLDEFNACHELKAACAPGKV